MTRKFKFDKIQAIRSVEHGTYLSHCFKSSTRDLATPPLGSFIVPYVILAMAYPTKKQELSYRKQIARQLHKH